VQMWLALFLASLQRTSYIYIYIYIYICMYVLILLIKLLDTFDRQHVLFLFIVFLLSFACVVICG
jgi:hypothetical protein